MKITISGDPGSGKSTISKLLIKELKNHNINLESYSMGSFFREKAKNLNIDIAELIENIDNNLKKKDSKYYGIHQEMDEYQKSFSNKDNFIMDSRLGFYFIKNSFKIFLAVKPEIAAKRIMGSNRKEEKFLNKDIYIQKIELRKKDEQNSFKKLYNIDLNNPSNYDLYLDTSKIDPNEVVKIIIDNLKIK